MAEPMVAMVSQVMTTLQGSVEAAESRVDATESRMAEMQSANKDLQQQLAAVVTRVTTLEQKPFVPKSERKRKSERVPDPRRVARKRARKEMAPEEKAARRKAAADKRQAVLDGLDTFTVTVLLPSDLRVATPLEPDSRFYHFLLYTPDAADAQYR